MPGVFLSYRRADTDFALEIYGSLRGRWGRRNIFWDTESIETGAKWADAIRDSVRTADAVLVLIGPDWLTVANDDGVCRLDAPDDWVRLEIVEALGAGRVILPILAPGARAPRKEDLPEAIAALGDLQAIPMDNRRFATRLIQKLEQYLGPIVPGGAVEVDPLRGERLTRLLTNQTGRLQIRAVELVEQGRYDRAIEELNAGTDVLMTLLDFAPSDTLLGLHQGYLYKTVGQAYQDAGREDEAKRNFALAQVAFERVRDLAGESLTASERANVINGLGAIYQSRGDLVAAMRAFREATQLQATYAYAWHDLLGALLYLAERHGIVDMPAMRQALEQMELHSKDRYGQPVPGLGEETVTRLRNWADDLGRRVKDLNRRPAATAWMTYAFNLLQAEDFEKALAPLDEAIELDPKLPEPWVYRGVVRIGFGQLDEGLGDLEQAMSLRPGMGMAYYNAACGNALKGDRKKALDYLEEAIRVERGWQGKAIEDAHFDSVRHLRRFAKLVGTLDRSEKRTTRAKRKG